MDRRIAVDQIAPPGHVVGVEPDDKKFGDRGAGEQEVLTLGDNGNRKRATAAAIHGKPAAL
ncbi:MAG: hypothetical protein ACRDJC_05315 [Thermomicrobiales bacterium]